MSETLAEKMARLQSELQDAQRQYDEQMQSPAKVIEIEAQKAAQLIVMASQEAVNKIQAAVNNQIKITPPKSYVKLNNSQLMMANASSLSSEKALMFLDRVLSMYPSSVSDALRLYPELILYHLAVVAGVVQEGK